MAKWHSYLIVIFFTILSSSCRQGERGLVVGKIKSASKLATTEFTIDKVVHGTKTKRLAWVITLNEAKFIAYSQAKIKAGVDLSKLTSDDIEIDEKNKSISLTLPHVEVLNFSYPADKFKMDTLISGDAFLNSIRLEDQEQFFLDAEMDIRNNLEFMGIEKTTKENTIKLLEGMLKSLGYNEIYIEFREGDLITNINPLEE